MDAGIERLDLVAAGTRPIHVSAYVYAACCALVGGSGIGHGCCEGEYADDGFGEHGS